MMEPLNVPFVLGFYGVNGNMLKSISIRGHLDENAFGKHLQRRHFVKVIKSIVPFSHFLLSDGRSWHLTRGAFNFSIPPNFQGAAEYLNSLFFRPHGESAFLEPLMTADRFYRNESITKAGEQLLLCCRGESNQANTFQKGDLHYFCVSVSLYLLRMVLVFLVLSVTEHFSSSSSSEAQF